MPSPPGTRCGPISAAAISRRPGILTLSQTPGDFGEVFRNGLDRTGYKLLGGTQAAERYPFAARRSRALVILACSGHGYKFGAAVGQRTAEFLESGDFRRYLAWLRAEAARPAAA